MNSKLPLSFFLLLLLVFSNSFLKKSELKGTDVKEDNWEIMRTDSIIKDFQQIIAANKGKVVYVDFWASWCGPCMQDFKMAAPVKEAYENKDVVFLFISLDQSIPAWEKAYRRLKLNKNSFIVPDLYASKLVSEFKLNTIPRYLIYDKWGKLVKNNAPPIGSSPGIRLLDKYLSQ